MAVLDLLTQNTKTYRTKHTKKEQQSYASQIILCNLNNTGITMEIKRSLLDLQVAIIMYGIVVAVQIVVAEVR